MAIDLMKWYFCCCCLFWLPFRYWAVTNVDYIHARTTGRVSLMIFFVWISAIVVSLAPQFGWKDSQYMKRIQEQRCMVSQDIGYQVNDKIPAEYNYRSYKTDFRNI